MPNFQVFSDLHFDAARNGWVPELAPGADAIVCAGDVCEGMVKSFTFLRQFIPETTPIVCVAGNHSFYRSGWEEEVRAAEAAAPSMNIHFLEDTAAWVCGVRFIGATLWTDYELEGRGHRELAMHLARQAMNDHKLIAMQKQPWERFTPSHARSLHLRSRAFIESELFKECEAPTVVLTHHAPSTKSIHPRYAGHYINPAYVSDMDELILRHQPTAWVHGHVHSSFDYSVGATRILCNPHGYGSENAGGFNPALRLEIAT